MNFDLQLVVAVLLRAAYKTYSAGTTRKMSFEI